jgi:hypothetical protein
MSKASFFFFKFTKPTPPLSFGLVSISQAASDYFRVSISSLHKHCLKILSKALIIPGGKEREQRKYIGIEARAESTSWSLAPWDKCEILDNLLSNLNIRGIRSCIWGLAVRRGKPKYVKGIEAVWHPKAEAKLAITSSLTLIGTILDLWKFYF